MLELETKLKLLLAEKQEKIIPENIREGVKIFDVIGTYTGEASDDETGASL